MPERSVAPGRARHRSGLPSRWRSSTVEHRGSEPLARRSRERSIEPIEDAERIIESPARTAFTAIATSSWTMAVDFGGTPTLHWYVAPDADSLRRPGTIRSEYVLLVLGEPGHTGQ